MINNICSNLESFDSKPLFFLRSFAKSTFVLTLDSSKLSSSLILLLFLLFEVSFSVSVSSNGFVSSITSFSFFKTVSFIFSFSSLAFFLELVFLFRSNDSSYCFFLISFKSSNTLVLLSYYFYLLINFVLFHLHIWVFL